MSSHQTSRLQKQNQHSIVIVHAWGLTRRAMRPRELTTATVEPSVSSAIGEGTPFLRTRKKESTTTRLTIDSTIGNAKCPFPKQAKTRSLVARIDRLEVMIDRQHNGDRVHQALTAKAMLKRRPPPGLDGAPRGKRLAQVWGER